MENKPAVPPDPASQVFKWVLDGQSEQDIRAAMATLLPGSDPPKLLMEVMLRFRATAEAEADVVIGWAIEATRELYRRMVEVGDYVGALRAVKQLTDTVTRHVHNRNETEEAPARLIDGEEGSKRKPRGKVRKKETVRVPKKRKEQRSRTGNRATTKGQEPPTKETVQ